MHRADRRVDRAEAIVFRLDLRVRRQPLLEGCQADHGLISLAESGISARTLDVDLALEYHRSADRLAQRDARRISRS